MTPSYRRPRFVFDAALLEYSALVEAPLPPTASDFLSESEAAGGTLLAYGESLASDGGPGQEAAGRFVEAAKQCATFISSAMRLLETVESKLAGFLPDGTDLGAAAGYPESPAAFEMRDLYRIAYEVSKDPAARELVLELSAKRTAERLRTDLPEVWGRLSHHLDEHGWVRTWNAPLEPLGAREAVQRIQNALLRWDSTTAGVAAGELAPVGKVVAGPVLPEAAVPLADAYRRLAGGLSFSPALFTKARWVGRPFWSRLAGSVGVEPDILPWLTPAELLRALDGDPPDGSELLARRSNGFHLHVTDEVEAHSNESPSEKEGELGGQSVALGRAVGRVKVVLNADDGGKLLPGDVLVTDLSTPTYEGQPSVFPYRGIPSVAIEKAAAVVTDEGGLLSHAAIVCRESQVPAILGAEVATEVLRDGMIVEVDATRAAGKVFVLEG